MQDTEDFIGDVKRRGGRDVLSISDNLLNKDRHLGDLKRHGSFSFSYQLICRLALHIGTSTPVSDIVKAVPEMTKCIEMYT